MTTLGSARWIAVVGLCWALQFGCARRPSTTNNASAGVSGASGMSAVSGKDAIGTAGLQAQPNEMPNSSGSMGSDTEPTDDASRSDAGAATSPTRPAKGPPDPNVQFEWPESSPGSGAVCEAGTYTGTFTCIFMDPLGLIPSVELTGPVSLTFAKSMEGEFLEIAEGDFEALSDLLIGGKAKIRGELDCNTLMLDAMAVDGEWLIGDPNAPLLPGGGLEGEITGTLDPMTGTLSGEWTFYDPELGACPGTWTVTYAP